MPKKHDNRVQKGLQNFFNIRVQKKKDKNTIIPVQKDANSKDSDKKTPVQFTSEIQTFYKWWLKTCHDTNETLRNRTGRINDVQWMNRNEPVISMATELYADEVTLADSQNQVLKVEAAPKVQRAIYDLFETLNITPEIIREIAMDLVQFGEHFRVQGLTPGSGMTTSTPLDVETVTDRIEFNAAEVEKKVNVSKMNSVKSVDSRLDALVNTYEEGRTDIGLMYQSYLFGFQLNNKTYLPPWNMAHFRLHSSKSEFYPWGRPLFINSISPFRQLKASKNLMAMARAGKIPKNKYEVATTDSMNEIDKWNSVTEAKEEWNNQSKTGNEEDMGVGTDIWVPEGLIKHSQLENKTDMGSIADVELLREDLIMGTKVPKGYLIVDKGGFGTSGQSLLQQYKPFGRAVYNIQNTILKELVNMIKIHFITANLFDKENTKFEVSMNFPVIEEASDRLRVKNDSLRLASDIISNIQSAMGTRDGLPVDVIKSIFSKISFLDPEDVDEWLKSSDIAINGEMSEETKKKVDNSSEDVIKEAYFLEKKRAGYDEGLSQKRHWVGSWKSSLIEKRIYECLNVNEGAEGKEKINS